MKFWVVVKEEMKEGEGMGLEKEVEEEGFVKEGR